MWNHSLQNDNYTPVRNIFLSILALDSSAIINLRLIGSQACVWLLHLCVWTYTYTYVRSLIGVVGPVAIRRPS